MAAPVLTAGMTLTFDSGFFARVMSAEHTGRSREEIDTTHWGSTNGDMTSLPSDYKKTGSLSVTLQHDPQLDPPTDSAAETLTITYTNGATRACSAYMTAYNETMNMGDKITATATIVFTGSSTLTPA